MPTGSQNQEPRFRNMLLEVDGFASEIGTATASAGAATCNDYMCIITSEALTTAQNAKYTLTLTNDKIAAADMLQVTVGNGTNSAGTPILQTATPAAGSATIIVANKHDSAVALNGTLKIYVHVIKAL